MGVLALKLLVPALLAAQNPVIHCTSGNGTKYSFTLAPTEGLLEIQTPDGKTPHALSDANLGFAPLPKNFPTYYVETVRGAKTVDNQFQMGNRLRAQFFQQGGTPKLAVDLTYRHKPLRDLKCRASTGLPVVSPSVTDPVSLAVEPLTLFGGKIDEKGESTELSLLATEASLLQFLNTPDSSTKEGLESYLAKAGSALLAVPPSAIEKLRGRFTKREKEFLDVILTNLRYKFHSDAQRYASWVAEGLQRQPKDWAQVRAGFRGFFLSQGFGAAGMESFFEEEMKKTLPQVSAYDLAALTDKFSAKEESLVVKIWGAEREGEYRPLKKAYPMLSAMEHNLTRAPTAEEGVRKSKFDEFVVSLSKLMQDPAVETSQVKAHFKANIVPLIDRLDPKEKKSLTIALGEGGNRALSSLK